jgi:phosphoglycerate kinase
MGVFEFPAFSRGTRELMATIGSLDGVTTILGGGSTAEMVDALGLADRITHLSTGGGASLEFLEGKTLPGIAALLDKEA